MCLSLIDNDLHAFVAKVYKDVKAGLCGGDVGKVLIEKCM